MRSARPWLTVFSAMAKPRSHFFHDASHDARSRKYTLFAIHGNFATFGVVSRFTNSHHILTIPLTSLNAQCVQFPMGQEHALTQCPVPSAGDAQCVRCKVCGVPSAQCPLFEMRSVWNVRCLECPVCMCVWNAQCLECPVCVGVSVLEGVGVL